MAYVKSGNSYYVRYRNWKTDPIPYIYVIWYDKQYTSGFNLHYLAYARFNRDIPDVYKLMNEEQWERMFNNLKAMGLYKNFLTYLDDISAQNLSRSAYQTRVQVIKKRWPWAMKMYRLYFTNKMVWPKKVDIY